MAGLYWGRLENGAATAQRWLWPHFYRQEHPCKNYPGQCRHYIYASSTAPAGQGVSGRPVKQLLTVSCLLSQLGFAIRQLCPGDASGSAACNDPGGIISDVAISERLLRRQLSSSLRLPQTRLKSVKPWLLALVL